MATRRGATETGRVFSRPAEGDLLPNRRYGLVNMSMVLRPGRCGQIIIDTGGVTQTPAGSVACDRSCRNTPLRAFLRAGRREANEV
jgi:hypothetical protein